MQVVSLELKSIIGRNRAEEFEGWAPRCRSCIVPGHAGLGILNRSDVFQSSTYYYCMIFSMDLHILNTYH